MDKELTDLIGQAINDEILPQGKDRREIANAIINGNKCGSFSSPVVQPDLLNELDPMYVHRLKEVCDMHRNSVFEHETGH